MRYGIFSDVHSNFEAFTAVLHAFSAEEIDQYVCVGDVVGYGADAAKCIEKIEGLSCFTVAGNHDWAVSDLYDPVNMNEAAREAVLWTEAVLSWEEIGYLKSLELVAEKETFTAVHGSLDSPADFNYILTERDVRATFRLLTRPVCFIGHTHCPAVFQYAEGAIRYRAEHRIKVSPDVRYVVNVGSVGQPRDGDPRAAYAVYDEERQTVEIKRVAYEIKKAQEKILKAGLPSLLAYRLSTGT